MEGGRSLPKGRCELCCDAGPAAAGPEGWRGLLRWNGDPSAAGRDTGGLRGAWPAGYAGSGWAALGLAATK